MAQHRGCTRYDLHGINPKTNEGTFPFKSRLAGVNGREVNFLGEFDAYPNVGFRWLATFAGFFKGKG